MEKRITKGSYVPTGRMVKMWHCGTCGFTGTCGTWKAIDGEKGTWCYKCAEKGVKSALKDVEVPEKMWQKGLVEVNCCGVWIECHGTTSSCQNCGKEFNISGQELAPREQWGEETNETSDDFFDEY